MHIYSYNQLQLFAYLQDTDSIFAAVKVGHSDPFPTDDGCMGSLANELEPGVTIQDWVTLGPKNYAYRCSDGRVAVHIRGFSMSIHDVQNKLNFDSMRSLLIDSIINNEEGSITTENEFKITRDKVKRHLITTHEHRTYRFRYIKQRINKETLSVEPYGYRPPSETT